jgi:hypothetical protein
MIKGLFLKEREGQKNTINYKNKNIAKAAHDDVNSRNNSDKKQQ